MRSNLPLNVTTWIILMSAATILFLGVKSGLPNAKRSELLTWGRPLTADQSRMLKQLGNASREGRNLDELCGGNKLEMPKPEGGLPEALRGPLYFAEKCLIFDLKRFIVSSSVMDEFYVFSKLSDMNPSRLDFNPRGRFEHGNSFVFPLGALLYVLKSFGALHVTKDISQYLVHPNSIEIMYMAGRSIGIVSFLAILFLLNVMGNRIGGAMCGIAAMLTFVFSTLPWSECVNSKPHLYAAFWVLLTVYLVYRFMEAGSKKHMYLAVFTAGWATAAVLTSGVVTLFFPVALFDGKNVKRSLAFIFLAFLGVLAVFLVVNPYTIIDFQGFRRKYESLTFGVGTSPQASSLPAILWYVSTILPVKLLHYLATLFQKSYCFPAAIFAWFGLAAACVKAERPLRLAAAGTLALVICSSCVIAATLAWTRYTLFMGPLICLFAGYGISLVYNWLRERSVLLRTTFLIAVFLPGACFAGLFAGDLIYSEAWYAPTKAWVSSIPARTRVTVGVLTRLSPIYSPPFPFIDMTVLNLNRWEHGQPVPDYVLIGKYPQDRVLWERHPLRNQLELAFNLGHRESYEWFKRFREESPSLMYGWVYKRKDGLAQ